MKEIYKIYKAIKLAIDDKLQGHYHIALWNNNTEKLQQEVGFKLPAVFVEIEPFRWEQRGRRNKVANAVVKLHFISNAITDNDIEDSYNRIDEAVDVVTHLSGDCFNALQHVETTPDVNYDEIREDIETFTCEFVSTKQRQTQKIEAIPAVVR